MIPHPTVSLLVISGHNDQITIDTSSAHCIITQGAEGTDAIFQISIVWVRFDMIIDPNIVKLRSPPGPVTGTCCQHSVFFLTFRHQQLTGRIVCITEVRASLIISRVTPGVGYRHPGVTLWHWQVERERADITRRGRGEGVLAVNTRVPWDTCSKQRNTALSKNKSSTETWLDPKAQIYSMMWMWWAKMGELCTLARRPSPPGVKLVSDMSAPLSWKPINASLNRQFCILLDWKLQTSPILYPGTQAWHCV